MTIKLPDLSSQERPIPKSDGGLASYSVPTQGFEAPGRALMQAGDTMHSISVQLRHEQERQDTLRAEEAFTKLRERQLELTAGEKDGYDKMRGSEAVKRPLVKEWGDRFNGEIEFIAKSLDSDEQRQKFIQRAGVANLQFKEGLLRHVMRESDVYAKEVFEGTVRTEQRFATANWSNPNEVGLSMARIDAAVKDQAERFKWPAEYTEAKRLEAAGRLHAAVIDQAIAEKSFDYAKSWYDTHKDEIDKETAVRLIKTVEDAEQKQIMNTYTSDLLASRESIAGLNALEKKVTADQTLDDTRKNALLGRIQGRQELLANRAERDAIRRERIVEKGIANVNNITLQGYEPTIEQMQPIIDAAKGNPSLEAQAAQMVQTANLTRTFRLAPPAAQEQYLNQLTAAARKDPTKFDVNLIGKMQSIHDSQKAAIQTDPVTFSVRQGLVPADSKAIQTIDISKPETFAQVLPERMAVAYGMAKEYKAPVKPLTAEELKLANAYFGIASTEQKKDTFAKLAQAAGGDPDGYKAIMAQLAPDNPVLAHAGIAASRRNDGGVGATAAELMLRGDAILNPRRKEDGKPDSGKLLPMPKESEFRVVFDSQVRNAYSSNPEARNGFYQAAKAIYAGMVSKDGGKDTTDIDTGKWKQAITMATGGIAEINGSHVPLPWGKDVGQMKDGMKLRVDELYANGRLPDGVTPSMLMSLPLIPVRDGVYAFRSGDKLLVGKPLKDGGAPTPLLIDFNRKFLGGDIGRLKIDVEKRKAKR